VGDVELLGAFASFVVDFDVFGWFELFDGSALSLAPTPSAPAVVQTVLFPSARFRAAESSGATPALAASVGLVQPALSSGFFPS
jgi:hypothetical protein